MGWVSRRWLPHCAVSCRSHSAAPSEKNCGSVSPTSNTRSAAGKAGVQFWVVQAGGELARGNATTHRIKLSLTVPPSTLIADEGDGAQ